MIKKLSAILLIMSFVFSIAACGDYGGTGQAQPSAAPAAAPAPAPAPTPAAANSGGTSENKDFSGLPDVKIKFASWFADTHPQILAVNQFKDEVFEKSGGKIVVEVYGNNQLGSEDVYIDSIKQGTVEMGAAGTLMARDVPLVAIAEMPFLFDSWEHARKVLGGEIGQRLTETMPEVCGIRTLAWTVNGFRQVSSNKPVMSVNDFKGLRLRVPNTPVYIKMFSALGVNPIAMAFSEVFTALEQKVVDGQDNPYATVKASSIYEVQSNILETKHMFSPVLWIVNDKFYQGLPEEFREIVDEAIANAADTNWKLSIEADTADKQALEELGLTITVPSDELKAQLVQAQETEGVYEWFYNEYPGTREFAEEIKAVK